MITSLAAAPSVRLPRWRRQRINAQVRMQDHIMDGALASMDQIFHGAVNQVIRYYQETGMYHEPSLLSLYQIGQRFYYNTIKHAYIEAEKDMEAMRGKARLALGPTPTVKSTLNTFEKFFRDKRAWPAVLRRNQKFIDQLRAVYLRKLQHRFQRIIPKLTRGEVTIEEVKTQLMETWDATRSRVTLIFRTESATYFGKAQVNYFKNSPQIIGFMLDTVNDSSITEICRTRHGLIYPINSPHLKDEQPALHYNCRSRLIALTDNPYNRKLLDNKERNRDTTSKYLAPLLPGWRSS